MQLNKYKNQIQKLFSFFLCTAILFGSFALKGNAQTRRRTQTKNKKPGSTQIAQIPVTKSEKACNGGWSGIITYTKTLQESGNSDEPGIRKSIDRIIHQWSHNFLYEGRMTVDGSGVAPIARGAVEFSDVRKQYSIEKIWDSCGAWKPEHWFVIDGKRDEIEQGNGAGEAKSFNLNVDYASGKYNFSFAFPDVKGKYNLEDHTTRSGHCQPQNNEPIDVRKTKKLKLTAKAIKFKTRKSTRKRPTF